MIVSDSPFAHLGVVEEVDAGGVCGGHTFAGGVGLQLVRVRNPRAERQFANLEAGKAETAVVHRRFGFRAIESGCGAL